MGRVLRVRYSTPDAIAWLRPQDVDAPTAYPDQPGRERTIFVSRCRAPASLPSARTMLISQDGRYNYQRNASQSIYSPDHGIAAETDIYDLPDAGARLYSDDVTSRLCAQTLRPSTNSPTQCSLSASKVRAGARQGTAQKTTR